MPAIKLIFILPLRFIIPLHSFLNFRDAMRQINSLLLSISNKNCNLCKQLLIRDSSLHSWCYHCITEFKVSPPLPYLFFASPQSRPDLMKAIPLASSPLLSPPLPLSPSFTLSRCTFSVGKILWPTLTKMYKLYSNLMKNTKVQIQ